MKSITGRDGKTYNIGAAFKSPNGRHFVAKLFYYAASEIPTVVGENSITGLKTEARVEDVDWLENLVRGKQGGS